MGIERKKYIILYLFICIDDQKEYLLQNGIEILLKLTKSNNDEVVKNILGIITNVSEENSCIRDLAKTNCLEIIIPLFETNNCEVLTRLCETCYNLTFKCIYYLLLFLFY